MPIYRVVYRDKSGKITQKDYAHLKALLEDYRQVALEEDSYNLRLHGQPILKGLIGPLSEGRNVVRYEAPDVYQVLTEKWSKERRRRNRSETDESDE